MASMKDKFRLKHIFLSKERICILKK